MAESAVNISSIQQKRPNIFELVAQESLVNHIHPALKSLCVFAAEKKPGVFGNLLKWYEEVFLGANLVLQYYYLKGFNASFSEAFYGLRRIKALSETTKGKLPSKVFAASLICLAVLPYLKQKLAALNEAYESGQISQNAKSKALIENLIKYNKYINSAYGALRLYYLASYAAGFAKVHDPLLRWSGVQLVYHDRNMPSWKDIWKALFSSKVSTPKVTLKLALKLIASSLEIGAFFIQFLSWWHSDESKVKSLTKLPIPKAPHINNGSTLCPICLRERNNEVVLMTSGYVFCYICIKDYLNRKGMCPVTNLPSNEDSLVRIFSSDNL